MSLETYISQVDFKKKIVNSDKFRQACIRFLSTGSYCLYPVGTTEYYEFWDEELRRCTDGYTAEDGDYITGYNYFYLNYCPIDRIVYEKKVNRFGKEEEIRVRKTEFPDFYDYDYYFFQAVLDAEEHGKHLCLLKSRRKGYEQPYSEDVLTPTGFVKIGSLKVGDYVMNPNGSPVRIGEIVEQGVQEVYEVEFQDGRIVRCGANHLWATCRNGKKFYVMPTKEYAKRKLKQGSKGKEHYPYKVPALNPLKFNETLTTIDPYVLGVLLGDGYICGSTIAFSTDDQFIVEEMSKRLPDYIIKKDSYCKFRYNISSKEKGIHRLGRELSRLRLRVKSYDKFIPEEYKYTSIEKRFELIRGLMDTDGSITNGAATFVSTSEKLIDDLIFILRSLGIRVHKSKLIEGRIDVEFNNGKKSNTRPHWELCITTQEDIFKLPRKLDKIRKDRTYNYNGIGIKSIRATGIFEQQRCLCIDAGNQLYITKDFIPTHNSYKCSSMACRNYYLIPGSKSYIYASDALFLTGDGTFTKVNGYMSFIDKHTAFAKKKSINKTLHKRAGFFTKDEYGNEVELGYKSEIIGASLKDNPSKVRGKAGKLILFEEGGSFPELAAAWSIARPSVELDGIAFGLMIVFGTGGDSKSNNFVALKDMFYKPAGYNCLLFNNIWDEAATAPCGFFCPQYANLANRDDEGNRIYMDNDGNTNTKEALDYILSLRKEVINNATNSVTIDRYVAENAITPQEACLDFKGNIFPKKELLEHLSKLRTNKALQNHKQVGDLTWGDNGLLIWTIKKSGDITHYPLNKDEDDTKGSIVIWEHPVLDAPTGLYIAGCLTPGERVLTDKGYRSVETVTLLDKLVNKDGRYVDIYNLLRYQKVDEPIYKVRVSHNYSTTTFTSEHPLYVSDLAVNGYGLIDEDKFDFKFVKMKDVKPGLWIKYPNIYKRTNNFDITLLWDNNNCRIDRLIEPPLNNKEFWWFIGLWLGDGWTVGKHKVEVVFNLYEREYIDRFLKLQSLFDRKFYCKKNIESHTELYSMSFMQLNLFLTKHFGKYADKKHIPEWVKYIDPELKKALIQGYLDSDGCVYNSKKYSITEFVSTSLLLLEDIQDILFSLGLISNLCKLRGKQVRILNKYTCFTKPCYQLRIAYHDSVRLKSFYTNYDHKLEKISISEKVRSRPKDGCFFSEDLNYIYFKIRDIDKSIYNGIVYNFECDTHTFLTRCITTHNCDSYDYDQSSTTSLGSCFIYKRFLKFESYYDIIVAEYTGRPNTAEEFYENVRKLLVYYNAKCMYENLNKGIFAYFTSKHCDYLLADLPDIISDVVGNSKVQRKKGCHMNKLIKAWGEGLLKDWLNEEKSPGVKNLTTIMSEPLLEELIMYNDTLNADRVMSMLLVMIYREELYNVVVKKAEKENKLRLLFDGPIFAQDWYDDTPKVFSNEDNVYTF